MNTMTPEHKRWEEFTTRLEGIEGCDFQDDEEKGVTWVCAGGNNKPDARKILRKMNRDGSIDIEESIKYFTAHGGHCDCEILFNVA